MITILLTGANGQVGREIQDLAKTLGYQVIAFSRQELDITDKKQVTARLADYPKAAVLINAAAYTAVDLAEDEPEKAYAINCQGVENLATACKTLNLPLLHISTDYVFSGDKQTPYIETDTPDPQSVYGASKLAGEQALQALCLKSIIVRISWVFGQYGHNFVKTITKLAKQRESLSIVSDQVGNPTAAADIARVLLELTQAIVKGNEHWGIYHYCGSQSASWYEFAQDIITQIKPEQLVLKQLTPIPSSAYPTKATRPMNARLACGKLRSDFGLEQYRWLDYLNQMCVSINETELQTK